MKMLKTVLVPAIAVLAFSAGAAFAQTATPAPAAPAPATTMAPAAKPAKPAMTDDQKTAISKACSAAADKQGLKGKPRKAFRQSCKSHGGPAS